MQTTKKYSITIGRRFIGLYQLFMGIKADSFLASVGYHGHTFNSNKKGTHKINHY